MARKRRSFKRKVSFRPYRKVFLIATEGAKTEPIYFGIFNNLQTTIQIKLLPARKHNSSPPQVLRLAKGFIKEKGLSKKDEVWLVIDRDQWTEEQLHEVLSGCQASTFNLAVSNPKFEYWLLLHFEDGSGVTSSRNCKQKLLRYLPHFEKGHLELHKVEPGIPDAIDRAAAKDIPPCEDWPRTNGSTVYRLVNRLREHLHHG